jgi:hypothetical protein
MTKCQIKRIDMPVHVHINASSKPGNSWSYFCFGLFMMCRFRLRKVAEHRAFNNVMMLAILASTVMLAMEYDGRSSYRLLRLAHVALMSALLIVADYQYQCSESQPWGSASLSSGVGSRQ